MKVSDESIVAAVVATSTNLEAAKRVGLSERQFYKRLQTESVQGKLRKAQSELLDEAIAEMRRGLMQSIQVIFSIMTDSSISPQVRCREGALKWITEKT